MGTTLNLCFPSFSLPLLFFFLFPSLYPKPRSLVVLFVSSLLRCSSAVNCLPNFPLLLIDGALVFFS